MTVTSVYDPKVVAILSELKSNLEKSCSNFLADFTQPRQPMFFTVKCCECQKLVSIRETQPGTFAVKGTRFTIRGDDGEEYEHINVYCDDCEPPPRIIVEIEINRPKDDTI